jgi:hypothetical protein
LKSATCIVVNSAARQQGPADEVAECGLAGVDQPDTFGLGKVSHTRRLDDAERFDATPGIVAGDMT